jgi:hypothetical protein
LKTAVFTFSMPSTEWNTLSCENGWRGACGQAGAVDVEARAEALRHPQHQRHVGLLGRRDHVGRAVQVHILFAERLAVVGHVQHRRVDAVASLLAQQVDGLGSGKWSVYRMVLS